MNLNLSRSCSYCRVAKEDPDEKKHRRAQFLINRELQRADSIRRRRSTPRMVISKLKIKVGSRLMRLRKTVSYTISVTRSKVCRYRKIIEQIKNWKRQIRICSDEAGLVMVAAPLFTLETTSSEKNGYYV